MRTIRNLFNLLNQLAGKSLVIAAASMIPATIAAGQQIAQQMAQQQGIQKPDRRIVVSLADRKLAFVEDGEVKKIYSVAVGKPSTPSPEGTFTIERRVANPVYHHNGRTVEPGPANPVGTRWMGLNVKGYGIHGTNEPKSIGKAASHGCIRMARADLEELYAMVSVGEPVEIVGQPDEETARLFDPSPDGPNSRPVLMAATVSAPTAANAQAAVSANGAAIGATSVVTNEPGSGPAAKDAGAK